MWDVATGENLAVLPHENKVSDIIFNTDGSRLAVTSRFDDNRRYFVSLWDIDRSEPLREYPAAGLAHVRFSPDGNRLAFIDPLDRIELWNSATGDRVATLTQGDSIGELHFSPDGSRLAAGSPNGQVRLIETRF